jgi:hypothetical protein
MMAIFRQNLHKKRYREAIEAYWYWFTNLSPTAGNKYSFLDCDSDCIEFLRVSAQKNRILQMTNVFVRVDPNQQLMAMREIYEFYPEIASITCNADVE